jgi:ABC-type transport system involved in multi-copper enzyme maturation permease subunit
LIEAKNGLGRERFFRVLRHEPRRCLASPVFLLAAAFGLIVWAWAGLNLHENAGVLATAFSGGSRASDGIIANLVSKIANPNVIAFLKGESVAAGAMVLVALYATPGLAILVSSDQVSSDIGRKHIRFLLPRVSRKDLFLSRLVGAWITWTLLFGGATLVLCSVLGAVDGGGLINGVFIGLRGLLVVSLYGLPFIALMSLFNTMLGNPFLGATCAYGAWLFVAIIPGLAGMIYPEMKALRYLMPDSFKYDLISANIGELTTGLLAVAGYGTAYALAGWAVLRRRDV